MKKIIINADDFGISHGVNLAICCGHRHGLINSASLMVNQKYAKEAVAMALKMPNLSIGLHLNLTNEFPAVSSSQLPLLTGKDNKFRCGFIKLLLLSLIKPAALKKEIRKEAEAQIKKALSLGINLSHIDSHRHVHMIPLIFKIIKSLAEKYNIPRIRYINESLYETLKTQKNLSCAFTGGLIKYIVLKILALWNNYKTDTYFFSILYTCRITESCLKKIKFPKQYKNMEIMLHPGLTEVDKKDLAGIFDKNVLSLNRKQELLAVLDKDYLKELEENDCESI